MMIRRLIHLAVPGIAILLARSTLAAQEAPASVSRLLPELVPGALVDAPQEWLVRDPAPRPMERALARDRGTPRTPAGSCPAGDTAEAGFRLRFDVTASLTNATVDARTLGGEVAVENQRHPEACGWRRQRTRLSIKPTYEEKKKKGENAAISRVYMADLQHLAYLPGNRFYGSANARYLHNTSLGVELQQTYSLVLGTEVETRAASMEFNVGPVFVGQNFSTPDPSTGFWGVSPSERISFPLDFIAAGAELTESVRLILPFQERGAWQLSAHAALLLPISPRLDVILTAFDDYLSNAPTGFDKNYLTTTAGISIRLGRLPQ